VVKNLLVKSTNNNNNRAGGKILFFYLFWFMNKELVSSDYKKWLLYSFNSQNIEDLLHLYKALHSGDTFRAVKVSRTEDHGMPAYTISIDNVNEELLLTEEEKKKFLTYLVENYFKTDDVDKVMIEKTRESESQQNHRFIDPSGTYDDPSEKIKVKPHPKETMYFNVRLAFSVLFYAVVAGVIVYGIASDISFIGILFVTIAVVLFLALANKIFHGIFMGMIRGNSIRITKDQFPDIYNIIKEQAARLDVTIPEIYITSGHFNAFVTKFSRSHTLLIFSEVIETTLGGNYDVLKYVTAHELCHIKQRHLSKEKYLYPSKFIPFLSLAHSRGCEYTCDRIGYEFSPKGSVEGILIMTTGKEIYSKFNIEQHIKDATQREGLWSWASEKFQTHPHLYKRLVEVKNYSKYK
jgi:Zn-dependent protease with chaperone function